MSFYKCPGCGRLVVGICGKCAANKAEGEPAARVPFTPGPWHAALAEAQRIVHEECVAAMGAAPTYAQVGYRIECRLLALAKAEGRSAAKAAPSIASDPAPSEGAAPHATERGEG